MVGGGDWLSNNNNNNIVYNTLVGGCSLFRVPCSTGIKIIPGFSDPRGFLLFHLADFSTFKPVRSPMVFPSDKIFIDTENLPLEALDWYLICFVHKINPQFIFPAYPCISTVLKLDIEPQKS